MAVLEFNIRDTGIGIPEDKIERIFESFVQAASDHSRKYGGTGLGLTITKQLIDLKNGTVDVQSKVGEGTNFRVTLPFQISFDKSEAVEKMTTVDADLDMLASKKILLVEDNAFNQIVAVDTLEAMVPGIKVVVAENGKVALEKLQLENFDLILMDVQMPVMDGYDSTRHIRSDFDEPTRSVPIIALTASATLAEVERCFASGMNDCVSKPFTAEILLQKISGMIVKTAS